MIEDVSDRRAHCWILGQKLVDEICRFFAEIGRYDKLSRFDAHQSILHCRAFERRLPSHHGVHDAAQTPQVRLQPVRLVRDDFWRDVVRRAT